MKHVYFILGFISILGIGFISYKATLALFLDTAASTNNTFAAAQTFTSPTPTFTPTPTSTPTSTPTPTPTPDLTGIANHVVISEVQISGDGEHPTDDEFVELYNPTASPIVMSGWRLTRKNSSGTEENLVLNLNGTVPAHGYFLIVDAVGYNGSTTADVNYSAPSNDLTNNYTVLLYSDAAITLVDKVGFGTAPDSETSTFSPNPSANGSIERKAYTTSTQASMIGTDASKGNGYDTDNNSTDFVSRTTSQPQNSASGTESP